MTWALSVSPAISGKVKAPALAFSVRLMINLVEAFQSAHLLATNGLAIMTVDRDPPVITWRRMT